MAKRFLTVNPADMIEPPSEMASMELSMWLDRHGLSSRERLWLTIQLLDGVKMTEGDDAMDVVIAMLAARYSSGPRAES